MDGLNRSKPPSLAPPSLLPQPPSSSRRGGVPASVAVLGVSDNAEVNGDAAGDHHLRRPTCQEVAGKRRSPWKTVFPPARLSTLHRLQRRSRQGRHQRQLL